MFVEQIVTHTPVWVWLVLAVLVWQGVCALSEQTVTLGRMLLMPVLFAAWGIEGLLAADPGPVQLGCWLAGVLLLLPLGLVTGPSLKAVDPETGLLRRGGSPVPLVRSLLVFGLKYGFAVAVAMRSSPGTALLAASAAVSGATAGYFAGWLLSLRSRYRLAPRATLQQPA